MFAFGHVQRSPRPSQLWDIFNNLPILLLELSLCSLVPKRDAETEFWVKEKKKIALSLYQAKEGHSRLVPQRLCPP